VHHSKGNCCKGEIRRRDFAEVGGARCPAARVGWPYGCSSQCRRAPESSWGRLLRAATPCFAAVRGDIVLCAANAAGEAIGHSPSYNDLRRTTETTGAEGVVETRHDHFLRRCLWRQWFSRPRDRQPVGGHGSNCPCWRRCHTNSGR
jgi:hypothetical protein